MSAVFKIGQLDATRQLSNNQIVSAREVRRLANFQPGSSPYNGSKTRECMEKIKKSEAEWRAQLTPEQARRGAHTCIFQGRRRHPSHGICIEVCVHSFSLHDEHAQGAASFFFVLLIDID